MGANEFDSKQVILTNSIWKSLERFSTLGIQLLCTFIIARFLSPADFGIIGMLTVFTMIGNTLIDSGFTQAIIREKNVSEVDYSSIFYFNIGLSFLIYLVLFFCSYSIAQFFNTPILEEVCKITFLVIPINAFSLVQLTHFSRELKFKHLCVTSVIASTVSGLIGILIAFKYQNVWALVFQNLMMYTFRTIILWKISKWRPIWNFSYNSIKYYFNFSRNLLLSSLLGNIFNNIYSIIIGKFYTTTDLGFFSQADKIKNLLSANLTQSIQSVTYPILSKVNSEGKNVKDLYKDVILTAVTFVGIFMTLVMCVSQDLMEIFMGDPIWRVSGTYLFILSINGILYPMHSINQNVLLVKGKSSVVLRLEIARRIIMICILLVTLQFDIIVFVCGNALYSIVLLFLNLYICGKPINYSLLEQLNDFKFILFRFFMVVLFSVFLNFLLDDVSLLLRFLLKLSSCLIFCILLFIKNRYFMKTVQMVLRKVKIVNS